MYNGSYDNYIRNILGYPNYDEREYAYDYSENMYNYQPNYNQSRNTEDLEKYYPEIYQIIYPMIQKKCKNCSRSISKEQIDTIVDELYSNIEGNEVYLNINLNNEVRNSENRNMHVDSKKEVRGEDRQTRQFYNGGLKDLIKVLLIRELIGGPYKPCNKTQCRPPFPPPGRPPFPPPNRPPFPYPPIGMPYNRDYDNIYEY